MHYIFHFPLLRVMIVNFTDDCGPPRMSSYFCPHQFLFFKFDSVMFLWTLDGLALTWIGLFKGRYLYRFLVTLNYFVQMFGPVLNTDNFLFYFLLLFTLNCRQTDKSFPSWSYIRFHKIIFMIRVKIRGRRSRLIYDRVLLVSLILNRYF